MGSGWGGGWKSTWQCLLSPASCWRHPPLADSDSPTACPPSPAAHPPIRPSGSPPMLTSFACSHTCVQGGGNPNDETQGSCCSGPFFLSQQNKACSSLVCRACLAPWPCWSPLSHRLFLLRSWSPPRGWRAIQTPVWLLRTPRHQSCLPGEEEPLEICSGDLPCAFPNGR